MKFPGKILLAAVLALNALSLRAADDPFAWPPITAQTKPWAYWWWMGSAVDKTNITKEMQRYHAAGLGGVHIIPIYGAKGFEDKYIKYLSPEWMEMMGWAVSEARRLGMDVDMTTGTGWCFGGPQVTDEDANASVVVKIIHAEKGKPWADGIDVKNAQAIVAYFADGKSQDLTAPMKNPKADWLWSPPTNGCDIYVISQKPSGQKVKRPAPGGEGWMLNLIYPHAMDDFLAPFTAAFANYTGPKPRAQYHDSYEYRSDWSPDFFAQFEKRRGYKLQNELPALFSKNPDEHAARVLCDYRQTVSEIMAEESLPKWVNWSHEHGFITRNEAHGSPGNWLDLYSVADIPETEFFSKHRNILVSKFASSAAHVKGGNLASSESGTWVDEHFQETFAEVKGLMDDLFLSGINHVFYHGCCYSPDEAGWPGWHFYASLEMNPRNSIWRDAPAMNAYIARVQSVLQSGKPDNDVLLYWNLADFWMQPGTERLPQLRVEAQGWFTGQPIGKTAKELWDKGYAFDYVSDAQISSTCVLTNKISARMLGGGDYQTIVVPQCKFIPESTFMNLLSFAQLGGTVVFLNGLPEDVSGLSQFEKGKWGRTNVFAMQKRAAIEIAAGKRECRGKIIIGNLDAALNDAKINREPLSDSRLSYVRRSFDGGWNYFIANRTETNFDGWIALARPAKFAVILNPMTGNSGIAARNENGQIHLQLHAGESVILRAFDHELVLHGAFPGWSYFQADGQLTEISGDWKIRFLEGGPVLPADFSTAKLASWTTFPDTNCQAFAGAAKYETTFDAPKGSAASSHFELNLGNVCQSARVKLNGKDYGTLILPPFRVVVDNLKPTGNVLEVEVTSVAANRIRDLDRRGVKWKTFRDINMVDINYKPFDASNWPLVDCGLLGPVTLTPVKAE
jgi:hypothetical protein